MDNAKRDWNILAKSFNYSYGQMTLMQQMALGKCVVAAKVPSLVDYVENGKTARTLGACQPATGSGQCL